MLQRGGVYTNKTRKDIIRESHLTIQIEPPLSE